MLTFLLWYFSGSIVFLVLAHLGNRFPEYNITTECKEALTLSIEIICDWFEAKDSK